MVRWDCARQAGQHPLRPPPEHGIFTTRILAWPLVCWLSGRFPLEHSWLLFREPHPRK